MSNDINENETAIVSRFYEYYDDFNASDSIDALLEDCVDLEFSPDEIEYVVEELLVPELLFLFAEKYFNCYDYNEEEDLNEIFQQFCINEGVGGLANQSAEERQRP